MGPRGADYLNGCFTNKTQMRYVLYHHLQSEVQVKEVQGIGSWSKSGII